MLFLHLFAQVDPSTLDLSSAAKALLDAVVNKNWWLVAGLVVWLLVMLVRTYGKQLPGVGKLLQQGWSGPALAVLFSAASALLTSLFAGEGVSLKLLFAILGAAASAVFTHEAGQKVKDAASAKIQTAADADKFFKGGQ